MGYMGHGDVCQECGGSVPVTRICADCSDRFHADAGIRGCDEAEDTRTTIDDARAAGIEEGRRLERQTTQDAVALAYTMGQESGIEEGRRQMREEAIAATSRIATWTLSDAAFQKKALAAIEAIPVRKEGSETDTLCPDCDGDTEIASDGFKEWFVCVGGDGMDGCGWRER